MPHITHNSGEFEWYTPSLYIELARVVLGQIDLDPASCKAANRVVRATKYYTAAEDGLSQPWRGRVWLNPPYCQPLVSQFTERLTSQSGISAAIALVPNSTETAWFQQLLEASQAGCFPKGRIKFWTPSRESAQGLQGQALFYLGSKTAEFCEAFSKCGFTWRK